MKHLLPIRFFIMTPSLDGFSDKAKETPSPHEVKQILLNINFISSDMKISKK